MSTEARPAESATIFDETHVIAAKRLAALGDRIADADSFQGDRNAYSTAASLQAQSHAMIAAVEQLARIAAILDPDGSGA